MKIRMNLNRRLRIFYWNKKNSLNSVEKSTHNYMKMIISKMVRTHLIMKS